MKDPTLLYSPPDTEGMGAIAFVIGGFLGLAMGLLVGWWL